MSAENVDMRLGARWHLPCGKETNQTGVNWVSWSVPLVDSLKQGDARTCEATLVGLCGEHCDTKEPQFLLLERIALNNLAMGSAVY